MASSDTLASAVSIAGAAFFVELLVCLDRAMSCRECFQSTATYMHACMHAVACSSYIIVPCFTETTIVYVRTYVP